MATAARAVRLALAAEREQLVTDGFCIIPNVLDTGMLDSLRRESSALLDELTEEEKRIQGGQGLGSRFRTLPRYSPISSRGLGRLVRWRTSGSIRSVTCPVSSSRASPGPRLRTGTRTGRTGTNRRAPIRSPSRSFSCTTWWTRHPRRLPAGHSSCSSVPVSAARIRGHGTDIRYEDPDTSIKYADAEGQIDVPITREIY